MAENIERKSSKNISNATDEFLDWNDYDEEYEEEDNKIDLKNEQQNQESKTFNKKDSSENEDDIYNDTYNHSKTNKDYSYSNNYRKNYTSHYNRGSFTNKKYVKQSRPFNKGYDSNYNHRSTFYNKKKTVSDNYKDYYKYKDHNYESKNDYKTVDKAYDYDNLDNYDKKGDKNYFGDKFHGKKYGYNNKYKNNDFNFRNTLSYSTRGFFDDDKKVNKSNKYKNEFKRFEKEEELNDKEEEENISKPLFYNSKINNNNKIEEAPINQQKYIKTEDFILIENLVNNINKIVRDTYISLKAKVNKNIEEQYGSLNINAETYVPKRKILKDNNLSNNNNNYGQNNVNYGPNIVNNNVINQNYLPKYYN
jgi:hypothetical protein